MVMVVTVHTVGISCFSADCRVILGPAARLPVQQPRRLVGHRSKASLSLTSDVQQIFPTMSFLWSKAPPCAPDSHVCRGAAGGRRPACASGTRAGARGKPVHRYRKVLKMHPVTPMGVVAPI